MPKKRTPHFFKKKDMTIFSFLDLRRSRPNGDRNSIALSEYHDFMGVGIFFLTIIVLKKKPPSHRNSAKIGIQMVI